MRDLRLSTLAEADAGTLLWSGSLSQTGLSQNMGALQVTGQQQPPGLAAAAAQPNSAGLLDIASSLLVEFIENEVSQHLTLVQAATVDGQPAATVPVRYPTRWADLRRILQKLAYNV